MTTTISVGPHSRSRRNHRRRLTPKQRKKKLNEQTVLFEWECINTPLTVNKSITLEEYVKIWLRDIAPDKLDKSTLARDKQDIDRFLLYLASDRRIKLALRI